MDTEIAYIIVGVLVMIGAIIAGGAIYVGLQKIANAINKNKYLLKHEIGKDENRI